MELQRGLPFAAISIEKSPLLACIQGRVAAKDDDYFTTVWVRGTDNQTDSQHSICKSENQRTILKAPEINLIAVCSHLKGGAQGDVGACPATCGHQLCPTGNSIDSSHGSGGAGVAVHRNQDRTLVRQPMGSSSPRGREQSQKDEEQLSAWNFDACQLVKLFGKSKHTSCA